MQVIRLTNLPQLVNIPCILISTVRYQAINNWLFTLDGTPIDLRPYYAEPNIPHVFYPRLGVNSVHVSIRTLLHHAYLSIE